MRLSIFLAFILLASTTTNAKSTISLEKSYYDDSYKHVAFFCNGGGSSHYNWVLSIVDELGSRGHNASFITTDGDVRFGAPFSHIETVSAGSSIVLPKSATTGAARMLSMYTTPLFSKSLQFLIQNYERDYYFTKDYFLKNNVDVAICDHWGYACMDAAKSANIPFIVSATIDLSKDSAASYVNNRISTIYDQDVSHQPFIERFTNRIIIPIRDARHMLPFERDYHLKKQSLGIPTSIQDYTGPWKNSLKLINAINGYIAPRPTGSLVELVGPILPRKYTPLNEDLQTYLDTHQRVAYVAFGQSATPSAEEIKFILTALLDNIETGVLDGLIWATVNAGDLFPPTIATSSGNIVDLQDDNIRIVRWAPQTAVLAHPSSIAFVSHGGLGSWYESMYTGTRMIMFPFFSDQPGNALIIERHHLGGILKHDWTQEQAAEFIAKIIKDEDGVIRKGVKKYQALTQIHSEHGIARAADLVEEVAYTASEDGSLPHRESADRHLSFIKSRNIDVYVALAVCVYVAIRVVVFVVNSAVFWVKSNLTTTKSKQQ